MKAYFPVVRPDRVPDDPRPWALQVLDVDARERYFTEEHGTWASPTEAFTKARELNATQELDPRQAFELFEACGRLPMTTGGKS